jgi:hypothetical protein
LAIGIGLGYIAGQVALASRAGVANALATLFEPREAADWLPYAVLLALGIAFFAAHAPPAWQRIDVLVTIMLVIGLPLRLLAGSAYVTQSWSSLEKLAYLVLLAAILGLNWLILGTARDGEHSRLRPLLFSVIAVGTAVVVALSGVLVYAELCGAVAAATAGALAAQLPPAGFTDTHLAHANSSFDNFATAGVLTCSLASLVVLGCFYGKLAPINAALVFVSMWLAGIRMPGVVAAWSPWQQAAVRIGLVLVPLVVAVARAAVAAQASMSSSPYAI